MRLTKYQPSENILPFNGNVELKLKDLCLTKEEVMAYGHGEDYQAFLWHISDLEIFDKPKELSEFRKMYRSKGYPQNQSWYLTEAPQSWCYVEVER